MNTTFYKQALPVIVLAVVAAVLLGFNYMSAQTWVAPTGTAPSNNATAPLNVGSTTQAKAGGLAATILAATTEVRSDRYCDALGQNCRSGTSTDPGGSGLGYGQRWRNMASVRSSNVWYQNPSASPIMVYVGSDGSGGTGLYVNVSPSDTGRIQVDSTDGDSGERVNMTTVVPPNHFYKYIGDIATWSELSATAAGADQATAYMATTYTWVSTPTGTCSAPAPSCGQTTNGTQPQTVTCRNGLGQVFPDSNCTGTKPPATGACTRTGASCPPPSSN